MLIYLNATDIRAHRSNTNIHTRFSENMPTIDAIDKLNTEHSEIIVQVSHAEQNTNIQHYKIKIFTPL